MISITIILIVVVALLTTVIFGLAWLGYGSCLKAYKVEVEAGKHDIEIKEQYHSKKKNKGGLIGIICSWLALSVLMGLFVTGIAYKASGENFTINNQTALVIKTGSMSEFYNDARAAEYNHDTSLQFNVGDICIFTKDFELKEGEVYGYKYKNIIITHRLLSYDESQGLCEFRGDANSVKDTAVYGLVPVENIVYKYTGTKIPVIGAFVLYAQSYFGLWSLAGIIGITVSSEIVYHKIETINRERDKYINPESQIKQKKVHKGGKKHEK